MCSNAHRRQLFSKLESFEVKKKKPMRKTAWDHLLKLTITNVTANQISPSHQPVGEHTTLRRKVWSVLSWHCHCHNQCFNTATHGQASSPLCLNSSSFLPSTTWASSVPSAFYVFFSSVQLVITLKCTGLCPEWSLKERPRIKLCKSGFKSFPW